MPSNVISPYDTTIKVRLAVIRIKNGKTYTFQLDAEMAELFDKYCAEASVSLQAAIEDMVVEMIEGFYLSVED